MQNEQWVYPHRTNSVWPDGWNAPT